MPRSAKPAAIVVLPPRKRAPKKKSAYSRANISRVRGHGDYSLDNPGPWGKFGSQVGGYAGNLLGSPYGLGRPAAKLGSKLGSYLHYIGKIFGSGDYVTSAGITKLNSLMDSQVPQFAGSHEVRIRHREYLGDIITSATPGAFQLQSFAINPGVLATYPWLSQVCGSTFQQYRLNGQVYEFRSMSADALNSTNTALGSVVMATDYDSKDALFTSKQQMENTEFGVSCKPSSCMLHAIECKRSQTSVSELYIRANAVPSGADPRLYDMGNFQIATVGMQAASVNIGELWVSYDVTLIKTIEQPPGFLVPSASYNCLTGATPSVPLGTAPVVVTGSLDNIGLTFTANKVMWPANIQVGSEWQYSLHAFGTAGACYSPGLSFGNGMTDISHARNDPSNASVPAWGVVGIVKYTGGATSAALPYVNFANYQMTGTTLSECFLSITQVNPGLI